ncbi:MAG: ABC transporter ATP-binding protein, partial [Candidatus Limnocylindria bacterium]|nr:ABC transporter ATP-binding protein [Candidatus Limnocylindria bacterium]
ERQRAVLAMALAQEADVLLLDEPTVHLDPGHQRALLARVRELAHERGLVVAAVLHDLNLAAALADRIAVVRDGRVVRDGPPAAVLDGPFVAEVFGPGLVVGHRDGLPFVLPDR